MWHLDSRAVAPFDFSGLEIRDLTAGLRAASASAAHIRVPPGAEHAPARSHRCDKYYLGLVGSVDFRVGDDAVTLYPHAVLFIEKGEWFAYANQGEQAAELFLLHVPPFDLEAEELATDAALVSRLRP
jgi:mannose-6-phosphate isomerase-like protein (cupin superfamily)